MNRIKYLLKDLTVLIRANLWLIPVIAALVVAAFYFVAPPPSMSATMATGAEGGGYAVFVGKFQENLKEQGFRLKLAPSVDSHNNLERLLGAGEVDITLVQSGQGRQFEARQARQLQTLGAVYQEPPWLFHHSNAHIDQLSDLLHLRLAVGGDGSGTRVATEVISRINDIASGYYPITWEAHGGSTMIDDLLADKLDVVFIVGSMENPAIQKLVDNDQLRLVSFRHSAAYEACLLFLKWIEVGEGLPNLPCNVSERNISTLPPVATLVINECFHPALIPLVLEATCEVMKGGSLLDKPGAFLSAELRAPCPYKDAERYYKSGLPLLQRYLPFCIASLADRHITLLIPFIAILIPLMKPIGPLYRQRIRAYIYRRYRCTRDIDHKLDSGTDAGQLGSETEQLEKLESEPSTVEVPLPYYHEPYELYLHLNFVIKRLYGLQERQTTQAEAGNLG